MATDNGGRTWHRQTVAGTIRQIDMVDASTGWILKTSGDLARTTNGGRRWTELPAPPSALRMIDFVDRHDGWASDGTVLYETTDGGTRWRRVPCPITPLAVDFSDALTGWVAGAGHVIGTLDGGRTWRTELTAPGGAAWQGPTWVTVSKGGTGWAVFGGRTWTAVDPVRLERQAQSHPSTAARRTALAAGVAVPRPAPYAFVL